MTRDPSEAGAAVFSRAMSRPGPRPDGEKRHARRPARRREGVPEFLSTLIFLTRRHKSVFGAYPNVIRPKTFNEKVLCRMLFDRRPILVQLEDKYAVRDFVKDRIGEHILPKWYVVTEDPSTIPFDDLPDAFVVKPTHGSHWVRVVHDKTTVSKGELLKTCDAWLAQNFYDLTREWPYKHIKPRIAVEEFIDDGTRPVPVNYRIFVFDGRVHLILADVQRTHDRWFGHYDRSWNKIRVTCRFKDIDVERPARLDEMIQYAELLGRDLDFVRIDMYHARDRVYFGEATTLPMGGLMTAYSPPFDLYLGRLWHLRTR